MTTLCYYFMSDKQRVEYPFGDCRNLGGSPRCTVSASGSKHPTQAAGAPPTCSVFPFSPLTRILISGPEGH